MIRSLISIVGRFLVIGGGFLLSISAGCIGATNPGLPEIVERSIYASLAADSFRFNISVPPGESSGKTEEFQTIITGNVAQPDRVQWETDPDGIHMKQIAADGFVFTKIDDEEYWTVSQGREALNWDPYLLMRRVLDAEDVVEVVNDADGRAASRRFTGTISRDPFPDALVEVRVDSQVGLLEQALFRPRAGESQAAHAPPFVRLDLYDYGVGTTVDVPSRHYGRCRQGLPAPDYDGVYANGGRREKSGSAKLGVSSRV